MLPIKRYTWLPEKQLERVDIGEINLAFAAGLPGSEQLDPASCLRWIDVAAEEVKGVTARHRYRFQQRPEEFDSSEARFLVMAMVTILQQNLGIRYNPERIHEPDFKDSRDLFIHGLVQGKGGTCCSLPILYLAIGRRLRTLSNLPEPRNTCTFVGSPGTRSSISKPRARG